MACSVLLGDSPVEFETSGDPETYYFCRVCVIEPYTDLMQELGAEDSYGQVMGFWLDPKNSRPYGWEFWAARGIDPDGAEEWDSWGFEPEEAYLCEVAGFQWWGISGWPGVEAATVMLWINSGHTSESKYQIWGDDFSPEVAKGWQDAGIDEEIALLWIEWGADLEVALLLGGNGDYSDVPSLAFRAVAGLSLSEAADWYGLGVSGYSHEPTFVGKAIESGLAYSEWAPFMRLVGGDDSYIVAAACSNFGRENAFECFGDLIQAGVLVEEPAIRRWLGLTAVQIFDSVDRGFKSADDYKPYAQSNINANEAGYLAAHYRLRPERVIQLWHVLQAGITVDVAIPWIMAGYSGAVALVWLGAGFSDPVAVQWHNARFSPSESSLWIQAGIHQPAEARAWARHSIDPAGALAWSTAGFAPDEAASWASSGAGPAQAAARREAGLQPPARSGLE